MPTMSIYAFERNSAQDAGPFYQASVTHPVGGWAWDHMWSLPDSHAVLAWERVDTEDVLDLSAVANGPLALSQIDSLLTSPASRSGPVRTSYITWGNVPAGAKGDPGAHADWELLIEVLIDFHVSTPWYCTDADGTLVFYVFPFLDGGGNLGGRVEGSSFHFDGGWAVCSGSIHDALQNSLAGAMASLQGLLDTALPLFASGRTFNMLYLLPGHGDHSFVHDDADRNVALAVIPN